MRQTRPALLLALFTSSFARPVSCMQANRGASISFSSFLLKSHLLELLHGVQGGGAGGRALLGAGHGRDGALGHVCRGRGSRSGALHGLLPLLCPVGAGAATGAGLGLAGSRPLVVALAGRVGSEPLDDCLLGELGEEGELRGVVGQGVVQGGPGRERLAGLQCIGAEFITKAQRKDLSSV